MPTTHGSALTRLYTHLSQSDLNESDAYTTRRGQTSSEVSVVRLAPHVYFDLSRWVVLREGEEIELTRRQAAVLAILAETPNTYRSTSELAHRVSTSRLYPVEEHSIEQTICALRRKLGESAKDARLIQGRRGLGYALMVEEDTRLASVGVVAYASVLAHG